MVAPPICKIPKYGIETISDGALILLTSSNLDDFTKTLRILTVKISKKPEDRIYEASPIKSTIPPMINETLM
jgi:transposase